MKRESYEGRVYGYWTVVNFERHVGRFDLYRCRCECGEERLLCIKTLTSGKSQSCGCKKQKVDAGPAAKKTCAAVAVTKGRRRIEDVLRKNGAVDFDGDAGTDDECRLLYAKRWSVEFYSEKTVFDFMVCVGETECMIAYDNETHFRVGSSQERFLNIVHADCVREEYCRDAGIPLLRVRYNQLDEAERLVQELIDNPENFRPSKTGGFLDDYWSERNETLFGKATQG